jgi:hypothetical protein
MLSFMAHHQEFSDQCKNGNHIECEECICNCHIPGTMDNLAKNIARLERQSPGLGESL